MTHELKHKPINALDSLSKGREFIFSALISHYGIMSEVDAHVNCIKNDLESLNQVKGELKSLETEVSKLLLRILDEQVPLFSSDRLKTLHNDCRELLNRVGRKGIIDYRYKLIETVNILKLVNWNLLQMDNKHLDDHEFLINATKEYVKNMEDFLKGDL